MKNQLATINKAIFTKKEIIERLIRFYILWIVIGIISLGISIITPIDSFSWPEFVTSVISWLLFGIIIVAIFDFVLTSYDKAHQISLIQDGNKYELECRFKSKSYTLKMKDVFRLQAQLKFTKNTDKIFIKYRKNERPKSISIIIRHEDLKQMEMIKRHIK